jgi:ribosome-binding protein aMBF1 (putative translation factor)
MRRLYCDACGDQVKAAYPVKVTFVHGGEMTFYVCLDCYKNGIPLKIDVKRKEQVAEICMKLENDAKSAKSKWLNKFRR